MKKNVLALILEATPQMRETVRGSFATPEFEVLSAANESQATDISARHRIDLLLLDLNRPLRAGWGILERLKRLNAGVPVVFLAEDQSPYEEAVGRHAGAVLQKPIRPAELAQTARRLLGMPAPGPALAARTDGEARDALAKSNEFRELQLRRYTAPYDVATPYPYRQWGINE